MPKWYHPSVNSAQHEIMKGSAGHMLFVSGILILCVFATIDFFVRIRMKRAGYKWAFLRGGTLNYNDYLQMTRKYGWSAWPVYLMWGMFVIGIALVIVAVARYGFRP